MMAHPQTAPPAPRTVTVAGAGILAGVLTLLLAVLILRPGPAESDEASTEVSEGPLSFPPGTCFNIGLSSAPGDIAVVDCGVSHQAEIVGQVDYPEPIDVYPGSSVLTALAKDACAPRYKDYLGSDLLTTSLDGEAIYPTAANWADGSTHVNCYLTALDGSLITGSLADAADRYPRPDRVVVARLLPGDCYRSESATEPTELDSRSVVAITACDQPHHGVFFGRSRLDFPLTTSFPDPDLMTSATRGACTELFQEHFGEPVDGFNYRYWRPSDATWAAGDRSVLCTILSNDLMDAPFTPSDYQAIYDVEPGVCFNFGPEETPERLDIADKVLPLDCTDTHYGQKVISSVFDDGPDVAYVGAKETEDRASTLCRQAADGVYRDPADGDIEKKYYKLWAPTEESWLSGDRRYACAFALPADVPLTESLLLTES